MKIFYVANARMPNEKAHGIQIAKMIEALIEQEADLELIVPNRKTESQSSVKDFYSLRTDVNLVKMPVIDLYRKGNWAFFVSSLTFMLSTFIYLASRFLKGEKAVIYTIDMDTFSSSLLPLLCRPLFSEFHDTKKDSRSYRFLFKHMDGLFVVNGLIKESLVKTFSIAPEKILVEPNAVDVKQFDIKTTTREARESLKLPQDKKIILYSGKFYDWKGLDILIDCAKLLPKNYVIYMVGGTLDQLKNVTKVDNIPELIVCAGERPFVEMPLWQKAADVLVILGTKKNDYSYRYTSPMKIFEYFAADKPIVASKTEALLQVADDSNVLFYEPDNPGDLANKIMYSVDQPESVRGRLEKARVAADQRSWQARAGRILEYISSHNGQR